MMFSKVAAPVYIPTVVYKDSRGCISSNKHVRFLSLRLIMTVPGQSVSEFQRLGRRAEPASGTLQRKGKLLGEASCVFPFFLTSLRCP